MFRALRVLPQVQKSISGLIGDPPKPPWESPGMDHNSDPVGLQSDARPAMPGLFGISENGESQSL